MSKIGRKPIDISRVTFSANGSTFNVKGTKGEFVHDLPAGITYNLDEAAKTLTLGVEKDTRENRTNWGTHRSLVANKVHGAGVGFERVVKLVGLGYKGQAAGQKIVFSIGYSHKVEFNLPKGITVDIDKTGQRITVKGADKFEVGNVCDGIRAIRPPEPYKGTGIMLEGEVIIRKAGKTKA